MSLKQGKDDLPRSFPIVLNLSHEKKVYAANVGLKQLTIAST